MSRLPRWLLPVLLGTVAAGCRKLDPSEPVAFDTLPADVVLAAELQFEAGEGTFFAEQSACTVTDAVPYWDFDDHIGYYEIRGTCDDEPVLLVVSADEHDVPYPMAMLGPSIHDQLAEQVGDEPFRIRFYSPFLVVAESEDGKHALGVIGDIDAETLDEDYKAFRKDAVPPRTQSEEIERAWATVREQNLRGGSTWSAQISQSTPRYDQVVYDGPYGGCWTGCGPVAAAILYGYWEERCFEDLIPGPWYDHGSHLDPDVNSMVHTLRGDMGTFCELKWYQHDPSSTWPYRMDDMVEYGRDQGLSGMRITDMYDILFPYEYSTNLEMFLDHVQPQIDADRPTVVMYHTDNGTWYNHYAVAEGYLINPSGRYLRLNRGWGEANLATVNISYNLSGSWALYDDTDACVPTHPVPEIVDPDDGTVRNNPVVAVFGTATHRFEAPEDLSYRWTSSRDGLLSEQRGDSARLSYGDHTITLEVTDSRGLSGETSVDVSLDNLPPVASIVSPTPGQVFYETLPVTLTGTCDDPWDIDLVATWRVQGATTGTTNHTGETVTTVLPVDSYAATFECVDVAGASDDAAIAFAVLPTPANLPPVVHIVSPVHNDQFAYHDTNLAQSIDFQADVSDTDGTVVGVTWAAREVGSAGVPVVFDTRETFTLPLTDCTTPLGCPSSLPVSFDITLTAEDDDGATSSTTIRITIVYWVT